VSSATIDVATLHIPRRHLRGNPTYTTTTLTWQPYIYHDTYDNNCRKCRRGICRVATSIVVSVVVVYVGLPRKCRRGICRVATSIVVSVVVVYEGLPRQLSVVVVYVGLKLAASDYPFDIFKIVF
jgi:hypothetical protein